MKCGQIFILFVWHFLWFLALTRKFLIEADNSISTGQSLSGKQTIFSGGGIFELGFFTPVTSHKFYLGIWYKNISPKTIVWVANRDKTLLDATSELRLLETGELALFGESPDRPLWSTKSTSIIRNSTIAVLLDNGNLVLRDKSNPNHIIWQSFDHPTDTWLPGGRVGLNTVTGKITMIVSLTSWITPQDPSPGLYSFGMNSSNTTKPELQLLWKQTVLYWKSGVWDGQRFALAPELGFFSNSLHFDYSKDDNGSFFTYSSTNSTLLSRIELNSSGQIMQWMWDEGRLKWQLLWSKPVNQCDVFSRCGVDSSCDTTVCRCLEGFDLEDEANWMVGNRTGGCVRRIPLQCSSSSSKGEKDGFLSLHSIANFPANSNSLEVQSTEECELKCLNGCDCTAYAYYNSCLLWYGNLFNIQQSSGENGTTLNIRLAAAQLKEFEDAERKDRKVLISTKERKQLLIIGGVNGGLLFLLLSILMVYILKTKLQVKAWKRTNGRQDLLLFNPNKETREKLGLGIKEEYRLPLFSFASVASATNLFSTANRLGRGGFGPVYKGILLNGQAVAVKRLSRSSIQGHQEFKNEIMLISELQHVNLVKLIGCCIEEEEKILIYEYMDNKSLDFFLFDPSNKVPLNWTKRKQIIEGISQGLLYLHKYSRLRIIHRDLKASNILLDDEMNAKISDFGLARICAVDEFKVNTRTVAGTIGYIAPEYATEGAFSVKSDVFSYGVLLLEIISGKKATSFCQHDHYSSLLAYAWGVWTKGRCYEMLDPLISDRPPIGGLMRHINIALLCVEESASDRPIMSDIIYMLNNENVALPNPRKPAFLSSTRDGINEDLLSTRVPTPNDVTISEIEAR